MKSRRLRQHRTSADLREERIRAMSEAESDPGLKAIHHAVADELMERWKGLDSAPAVETTHGGAVTVHSRLGHRLAEVSPDESVAVTTARSSVEVSKGGHVDVLTSSESAPWVVVRSSESSHPIYEHGMPTSGAHRLSPPAGGEIVSSDSEPVKVDRARYQFKEFADGSLHLSSLRYHGAGLGNAFIVDGQWGVLLELGQEPRVFLLSEVPTTTSSLTGPSLSGYSYRPSQLVLKQPSKDEPLEPGDLVEVLCDKTGWDFSPEPFERKVIRIDSRAPDWSDQRRYFFDVMEVDPWEDGVLRLGTVCGSFGTTKAPRPVRALKAAVDHDEAQEREYGDLPEPDDSDDGILVVDPDEYETLRTFDEDDPFASASGPAGADSATASPGTDEQAEQTTDSEVRSL